MYVLLCMIHYKSTSSIFVNNCLMTSLHSGSLSGVSESQSSYSLLKEDVIRERSYSFMCTGIQGTSELVSLRIIQIGCSRDVITLYVSVDMSRDQRALLGGRAAT